MLVTATAARINTMGVTTTETASSSRAMVLDASKSISGIATLDASFLATTTAYQPRLLSVNTLAIEHHNGTVGVKLGSTIVTASDTQLNYTVVEPGKAIGRRTIALGDLNSVYRVGMFSAASLVVTLATPQQPKPEQPQHRSSRRQDRGDLAERAARDRHRRADQPHGLVPRYRRRVQWVSNNRVVEVITQFNGRRDSTSRRK